MAKSKNFFRRIWPKKRLYKILTVLGLLLVVLIGAGIAGFSYYGYLKDPERVLLRRRAMDFDYDINAEFPEHTVNIAIIGFDRDQYRAKYADRPLPDVLGILSIDFESDQITFVRIPRDSYVPIYGSNGYDKINHSYSHGCDRVGRKDREKAHESGMECILKTVSNVLGNIPIHYYVAVDMDGVVQLVDAMGGVHYDVEETLYDRLGNVLVYEGPQQLSGEDFMHLVRHRNEDTGQDFGRIKRQIDLLVATFHYFRENNRFQNIPVTYRVYKDYVDTNLSYSQIGALALYAMELQNPDEKMNFYTLTGGGGMQDGIWYLVLNQRERVRVIEEVYGMQVDPWPPIVLRDTPPPPLKVFEYTLQPDETGQYAVVLRWEPGDDKPVRYELFRDGTLLAETEDTSYVDSNLVPGSIQTYEIIVYHYRAAGDPHTITVEIPLPTVQVPDVRGMNQQEAREAIEGAGLAFGGVEQSYDKDVPVDHVIRTDPAVGTAVDRGATVKIIVSLGPEPDDQKPPEEPEEPVEPEEPGGQTDEREDEE